MDRGTAPAFKIRKMKNKLLIASLAIALSAMTAEAVGIAPTNLTPGGFLTNLSNNSLATNLALAQKYGTDLSDSSVGITQNVENLSSTYYDLNPVYGSYAVIHFGNSGAGVPGGFWQVWSVGDGGDIGPQTYNGRTLQISSVRYVPDGGSTLMLLGVALCAIAGARRKFAI